MYPINQWIREGNFYTLREGLSEQRLVIFKNYSIYPVAIKKIEVHCWYSTTSIIIRPSTSFRPQLLEIGKRYFGTAFKLTSSGIYELKITRNFSLDLHQFIKYLHTLDISAEQQFPDELRRELETIAHFLFIDPDKDDIQYKHFLPEHFLVSTGHVNPNVKNSRLIPIISNLLIDKDYFRNNPEKLEESNRKALTDCQHMLAQGADSNQVCESGGSVLYLVVLTANINLAKMFLAYGAMPFFPGEGDLISPYEGALSNNNNQMLELFTAKLSPLVKQVPAQWLTNLGMWAHENEVTFLFRFSDNNSLFCTLKHSQNLTEAERLELYGLYDNFGAEQSTDARNELFATQEGKMFTLIRDQNKHIVGTVIYNIKMIDNEIWVAIDLELFNARHNNYGMMPVLTYSLPYSLQLLFPDTTIRTVFFSLTIASFRRVKDDLAYPKYQTEGMTDQVLAALSHFNYKFKFYSDGLSTFFLIEENPLIIKDTKRPSLNDCDEYLYERLRGNDGEVLSEDHKQREVLVSLPVAFDFLATLHRISAQRKINVLQIVCQLAAKLSKTSIPQTLFPMGNPQGNTIPRFANSSDLFWNNKAVATPFSTYKRLGMTEITPGFAQSKL